jgi:hypothetical protein
VKDDFLNARLPTPAWFEIPINKQQQREDRRAPAESHKEDAGLPVLALSRTARASRASRVGTGGAVPAKPCVLVLSMHGSCSGAS